MNSEKQAEGKHPASCSSPAPAVVAVGVINAGFSIDSCTELISNSEAATDPRGYRRSKRELGLPRELG